MKNSLIFCSYILISVLPVAAIDFPIVSVLELAQNPVWSQASETQTLLIKDSLEGENER